MSVQKGIEEDELEERGLQVEEMQYTKIQKQEGAGAFTEIHPKKYDWNIQCVERNGKNPNSF